MVWVPTERVLVVKDAVEVVDVAGVTVKVARVVAPSVRSTVPVGDGVFGALETTMLKVTDAPKVEGLRVDVTVVVVLVLSMKDHSACCLDTPTESESADRRKDAPKESEGSTYQVALKSPFASAVTLNGL